MNFANEYDIESFRLCFEGDPATLNLGRAAETLARLANWANENSDGWAYWPKACRAASNLITALNNAADTYHRGGIVPDLTDAELRKLQAPIRAFLTRQGASHLNIVVGVPR